jgi:hypothetical protein
MTRIVSLVVAAALLGAACGGGVTAPVEQPASLVASVASFDLSTTRTERFIVGLFAGDQREAALGTVTLDFVFLGETAASDSNGSGEVPGGPASAPARFLALPGAASGTGDNPTFDPPPGVRGVYGTDPITFPLAGIWEVLVRATVDGQELSAAAAFEVLETSFVVGPGDSAPRSTQPLPGDPSVPPAAIDSRLGIADTLPDPSLHQMTIAEAITMAVPVMVVVATPVFCVSRFCGPITDEVARLETIYGDRVEFAHLEVWEDFENGVLNPAAAEWISPPGNERGAEPWVFLVDGSGTIVARWDNVASTDEMTAALDELAAP